MIIMFKKIILLANKLDQKGLYEEANIIDALYKYAIEYPADYDPGPLPAPEPWESEMMEMDISPEAREEKQEYKKHEIPTDPQDVEELITRTKMMLKGIEYPESESDIWRPQEESEDVGEKWYFGTEGEPTEEIVYPEDMADDEPMPKSWKPSGSMSDYEKIIQQRPMPQPVQPSRPSYISMPRTWPPSGPARKKQ